MSLQFGKTATHVPIAALIQIRSSERQYCAEKDWFLFERGREKWPSRQADLESPIGGQHRILDKSPKKCSGPTRVTGWFYNYLGGLARIYPLD